MQEEINNHDDKKNEEVLLKLDKYIQSIVKKEGYVSYNVETMNISANGGGYIGALYEVDITGKTRDGGKETNIFVKNIQHSDMKLTYSIPESYKRENFVYTDLIKQLYEIQDEANIPVDDRYEIPKAFDECNDESIILENLTSKGYKTYYRMDVINLEYAELAVKDLARLHALSFALKLKKPDYFEKNVKNMECIYDFDENWQGFTQNMFLFSSSFLETEIMKSKLDIIGKIVDKYPSYMKDNSCIKTVCHGDYRHNNIMVKEINGKPIKVIAVDFQIIHYGNPVLDFIYFIFWGTDRQFRKKYLVYLKDMYYQHLVTYLNYFNIDAEDVFPKKTFEKEYHEKLDFGLMIAAFYLPFLFPPENDVPGLTDLNEPLNKLVVKVDKKYHERFRDIVADFIEWGYL